MRHVSELLRRVSELLRRVSQSIHLTGTVHLTGTLWVWRKDVLTSQRIFTQIQQINSQKISPHSTDFRTIDKNELNFL